MRRRCPHEADPVRAHLQSNRRYKARGQQSSRRPRPARRIIIHYCQQNISLVAARGDGDFWRACHVIAATEQDAGLFTATNENVTPLSTSEFREPLRVLYYT